MAFCFPLHVLHGDLRGEPFLTTRLGGCGCGCGLLLRRRRWERRSGAKAGVTGVAMGSDGVVVVESSAVGCGISVALNSVRIFWSSALSVRGMLEMGS